MEEVKLTKQTSDIVNRLTRFKKEIENGMTVGDTEIIKGINVVIEITKEINPKVINEEFVNNIYNAIHKWIRSKERNYQILNKYIRYGIDYSLSIIYSMSLNNYSLKKCRK